jgi:hypothetical protein
MKPIIKNLYAKLALMALGSFVLVPGAHAVNPPPDGGYPGFNTAEGDNALFGLTTGVGNTAVGWASLLSNTDGSFNTALGAGTLLFNVGNQNAGEGSENTATGAGALLSNTTGTENTANGAFALFSNTEGNFNTAAGTRALFSNTTGFQNTANGWGALYYNTTGDSNTATGVDALLSNTIGFDNTATGTNALFGNTTGFANTATGVSALNENHTGNHNTATGYRALENNNSHNNTATGDQALFFNTTGTLNTATGQAALLNNTTGNSNTALGAGAGQNLTSGDQNIDISHPGVAGESFTTRIGLFQTRAFISGIRGVTTGIGDAIPVVIDSQGQLGTISSSRRFKQNIQPMDKASEALLALKPVTFQYNSDKAGIPQFGLIAEEVAEVNPDLVVRDQDGQILTVRYDAVNAMLLNEFLKEHKKVEEQSCKIQEQEATIVQLKQDFAATVAQLSARLDEHTSQIQKVSVQIELSKPAPLTVAND